MASSPILLRGRFAARYVSRGCSVRYGLPIVQRRKASQLSPSDVDEEWKALAQEIKAGRRKSVLRVLEERGYVNQIAGTRDDLETLLTEKRVGVYVGIDPTAQSLHVGHMVPFMALFWMYLHGYYAVSLMGGGTAAIGDPSHRLTARNEMARETREKNAIEMHQQLADLWVKVEALAAKHGFQQQGPIRRVVLNNRDWLGSVNIIDFLSEMGSRARLGAMLSRDTVKNRIEKGDGMAFSEFTYPILQAWDWWHLYQYGGVQLQIGGADQYGNIVSGIDLAGYCAREMIAEIGGDEAKATLMGFTVPLLTTSSGEKFGKSAGNAVWLNPALTSSFDLYGYFVSTPDADVERLLKLFTFLPLPTIQETIKAHNVDPGKRIAQHLLARQFVELAHGAHAAEAAEAEHRALFAKRHTLNVSDLIENTAEPGSKRSTPAIFLPRSAVFGQSFASVLHSAGAVKSLGAAKRLIKSGGAYVRSVPDDDTQGRAYLSIKKLPQDTVADEYVMPEKNVLVLRVGKRRVRVIQVTKEE
ncbi:hypothetical protein EJ06DRAFT_472314 [Trichodelitschia bisporula]|uniref:Tyrosine--tRNA ligase n=1 Tax=Trichodelitschia bisporula TaxID=703511 RepID=A0A6G1I3A1_9PEZI|nr:hypothetical protein EJ06DRAFT_472314 [Trichodelitschia bisporula]